MQPFEFQTPSFDGFEPETLDEWAEAMRCAIQYWHDIHANPHAWATETMMGYDPVRYVKEFRGYYNGYVTIDILSELQKLSAEQECEDYMVCNFCNAMYHKTDGCDCEEADIDLDDEATYDDMLEYIRMFETWPFDEDLVWEVMTGPVYNAYWEALEPVIASSIGPMEDILEEMEAWENLNCSQKFDLLNRCAQIQHVHGYVINDYGDISGIDWDTAEQIINGGFEQFAKERNIEC